MSRWFKLAPLFALIGMSGCATMFDSKSLDLEVNPITAKRVLITITDPSFDFPNWVVKGQANWYEDADGLRHCFIKLRKYPMYLGHETDHCFREYWHPNNEPNGEDFK